MAKKSRKARAQMRSSGQPRRPEATRPSVPAARSTIRQAGAAAPVAAQQPVNYDYVKSDLITIGIIAGALIIVMIVLTFVPALK